MLVVLCGTQSFTYQDVIPSTPVNLVEKLRQTCKVRDSLRFRYWVKRTETIKHNKHFFLVFLFLSYILINQELRDSLLDVSWHI